MRDANRLSPIAWRVFAALVISLLIGLPAKSDVDKDRKNAAKSLAKEIEQAQFRKIYVPDFLDPSGARTEKGCYFASAFSTELAKAAHNFGVVNRTAAQKQLNELHISAQDLQQPEMLSKAAKVLGADAVLVGRATVTATDADLLFSLRDATSGKEIHLMEYHERLETAFEASFPAVEDVNTHVYYFPGLDGVSQPKCSYCPNPEYTSQARRNRVEGTVLTSVRIDEKGTITDVRVVYSPDRGLAQQTVDIVKRWRLWPSRNAEGNPIAVRTPVDTVFRLLN